MSKINENKLVPRLRFPEFTMDSEWKENDLGVLCQYWNGASHESGVCDNGNYFLISLNSIDINGNLKDEIKRISYTDNSLKTNDLVMVLSDVAHGNFLGLTDIIPNDKYVLNQRMAGLRIKDLNDANPQFIRYYINKSQIYFKSKGQGSSQLNLSKSAVTDFLVLKPPKLREQQKIASCLSSLDEIITAENKKLDVLKEHKKGLLQNLFPQEGETIPKLRFKEFEKSGEWVENFLGEISDILMCKRIFAEETNENKGVPFFKIGTLGGIPDAYISRELFEEYKSKYNYPRKGEVLITCSGTVGKCLIFDGQDAYFQDSNIVWIDNSKMQVHNELLYYLLSNVNWNILNSTTITRIYGSDLRKLKIQYPKDTREQNMVASCLDSCDKIIKIQINKIEELKRHKKGMLQGLFPSCQEIN